MRVAVAVETEIIIVQAVLAVVGVEVVKALLELLVLQT
jgi:hypothetical protein